MLARVAVGGHEVDSKREVELLFLFEARGWFATGQPCPGQHHHQSTHIEYLDDWWELTVRIDEEVCWHRDIYD